MLKRKAWIKPPRQPLQLPTEKTEPRAKMTRADDCGASVPKGEYIRSEAYRRAVAQLPCWVCDIEGQSQAAHADKGKGLQLKSTDLTCFPLCGPNDGLCGCHYTVGSTGLFTKSERRTLEKQASAATIATLILKSQGTGKEAQKLRETLRSVGLVL